MMSMSDDLPVFEAPVMMLNPDALSLTEFSSPLCP